MLEAVLIAGASDDLLELRTVCFPERQGGVLVMKKMEIHAILTSIVADFIMRAKMTLWRGPTGKVNGGWCMCVTKQDYEGPKVCFISLICLSASVQ